jgi:gluconolactonase
MSGAATLDSLPLLAGGNVRKVDAVGDRLTTNICFGGENLRTAYLTLSGTGRLA